MDMHVARLGQVFTPPEIVAYMLSLRANRGRALEPSAGNGAFSAAIPGCTAIEIDGRHAPQGAMVMDFFAYPETETYDTIIGNPPYVRFQDIQPSTKGLLTSTLFDNRSNLFLHFIEKAVRHLSYRGELIFIVPRELAKLTAARNLNTWLAGQGAITHYVETGDSRVFRGATPNCAIFRFEKGRTSNLMADGRYFQVIDGQMYFTKTPLTLPLSGFFDVKVGAVSGADEVFAHSEGNVEFVFSQTRDTGETRRMLYNVEHPHLVPFKAKLLNRGIRNFDESNWWAWGRGYPLSHSPRIYVNAKTRRAAPFFTHSSNAFDGSILALFPIHPGMNMDLALSCLNSIDWEELGFVCDGRFLFSQRTLQTCRLPGKAVSQLQAACAPPKQNGRLVS